MIALCDKCNRITDIEYKVKKHPNTFKETYFECDQCNYHFTCFVTDNKVRKMQRALKALRQSNKAKTEYLQERQKQINLRMEMLKQKVM